MQIIYAMYNSAILNMGSADTNESVEETKGSAWNPYKSKFVHVPYWSSPKSLYFISDSNCLIYSFIV